MPFRRGDDAGEDARDEQDQRDVLDGPLPARRVRRRRAVRRRAAEPIRCSIVVTSAAALPTGPESAGGRVTGTRRVCDDSAQSCARMRALVVTNMWPDARGARRAARFVRDQVEALRALDDVEVELFEFPPGRARYPRAARELRRRTGRRFDVVHAHFGLTAWPALARPRRARAP